MVKAPFAPPRICGPHDPEDLQLDLRGEALARYEELKRQKDRQLLALGVEVPAMPGGLDDVPEPTDVELLDLDRELETDSVAGCG